MKKEINKTPTELKEILTQASTHKAPVNFTDTLMSKIKVIVVRDMLFKKYFKRSWILTSFSIVLLLAFLATLTQLNVSASIYSNNYIRAAFSFSPYLFAASSTALILFQLNNIISLRYSEIKQTDLA